MAPARLVDGAYNFRDSQPFRQSGARLDQGGRPSFQYYGRHPPLCRVFYAQIHIRDASLLEESIIWDGCAPRLRPNP